MTTDLPSTETARGRLRAAQKAEARALRDVEAADHIRQRVKRALDEADASLRAAQLELVRVSGLHRAALLLDLPAANLRSATPARRQRPARPPTPVGTGAPLV